MVSYDKFVNEAVQWYVDIEDDEGNVSHVPVKNKADGELLKRAFDARACAGEECECSDPYLVNESDAIIYESMSDLQKKNFYSKLQKEKVRFKFRKINGEMRVAYGTLIPSEIEAAGYTDYQKKSKIEKAASKFPDDSVLYYDLEKHGFRSFKMSLFVKYLRKRK